MKKKNGYKKKIVKHLKGDIKTFKDEAQEDRELIKKLGSKKKKSSKKRKDPKKKKESPSHEKNESKKEKKVEKVMREYKSGKLHSGSKKGPQVKSRKQAVAIALSESGQSRKKKRKSRK